jgi:hypothetical protein
VYAPGPAGRLSRRPTGRARPRIASPIADGGAGAARTAAHCCPPCQARFVPGTPHGLLTLSGRRLPGRPWAPRVGDDRALTKADISGSAGFAQSSTPSRSHASQSPRGNARCLPGSCSCSSRLFGPDPPARRRRRRAATWPSPDCPREWLVEKIVYASCIACLHRGVSRAPVSRSRRTAICRSRAVAAGTGREYR